MPGEVVEALGHLLGGYDFPGMKAIHAELHARCEEMGHVCPSRATLYKMIGAHEGASYRAADLPPAVQAALYNLDHEARVPARQVAFYAFNYGEIEAVQWAAGLPWLALYQAARMRGWRATCRGLLDAAMAVRKIR